jgi:hypothetical protein
VSEEVDFAKDVLEGDAVGAFFEGFAQWGEFGFDEWAVELGVELHARAAELFCEKVFHVAACVFDAAFFEVIRASFDCFEHRLHLLGCLCGQNDEGAKAESENRECFDVAVICELVNRGHRTTHLHSRHRCIILFRA